jgi:hypothetical protein
MADIVPVQIILDKPSSEAHYVSVHLIKETDMIKNSKQTWEAGEVVKVGFLTLRVLTKVPTPGNYKPDAYVLASANGEPRFYCFVPHFGVQRCGSMDDAIEAARNS